MDTRSLIRNLKIGEKLTFDDGRIVIQMLERTGRSSTRVVITVKEDVVINKPDERAVQRA